MTNPDVELAIRYGGGETHEERVARVMRGLHGYPALGIPPWITREEVRIELDLPDIGDER